MLKRFDPCVPVNSSCLLKTWVVPLCTYYFWSRLSNAYTLSSITIFKDFFKENNIVVQFTEWTNEKYCMKIESDVEIIVEIMVGRKLLARVKTRIIIIVV